MLRSEIFNGLKDILVMMDESKKDKIDSIKESDRLFEDLGLTSISLLYLMIAIEESFEIEFDGGVNNETRKYLDGLDTIVSGSYVCLSDNISEAIEGLR